MRVTIVSTAYPSRDRPAVGTFVRDQAIALAQIGIDVTVCHVALRSPRRIGRDRPEASPATVDGILVHRWRAWSLGPGSVTPLARLAGYRLCRSLGEPSPDVIHGHFSLDGGITARSIAHALARPLVITEHSSEFARGLAVGRRGKESRRAMLTANALIAVSPSLAEDVRRLTGREATVIPNVVDVDAFPPRLRGPSGGTASRIVAVGALERKKGHDLLVRALAILHRDWRATIVGEGAERRSLERLATRLGVRDRLELVGVLPRDRIRDVMAEADAVVSTSRFETFGIPVAEALSVGVPVVTTATGPAWFVEEPFGLIVSAEPQAIAAGIGQVLDGRCRFDPQVSHQRIRSMFEPRRVARRLLDVYREVAGG
jgi:glycosyltransferase involved in cell wall biosynthesis